VKPAHQFCVLLGDREIVIVDEHSIVARYFWQFCVAKIALKSGDQLLERLFVDALWRLSWIEMDLVYTFGKQPGKSPAANHLGNVLDKRSSFLEREMNICFRFEEVLLDLFVLLVMRSDSLKSQQLSSASFFDFRSSIRVRQVCEVWDLFLLGVLANEPTGVNFSILQSVVTLYRIHRVFTGPPVPDGYR